MLEEPRYLPERLLIAGQIQLRKHTLAKAIEKRMGDFNNPTAGPEFRIALQFPPFLATGADTHAPIPFRHCLSSQHPSTDFAGGFHLALDATPQYAPKSPSIA